jgi:hypothetical protein
MPLTISGRCGIKNLASLFPLLSPKMQPNKVTSFYSALFRPSSHTHPKAGRCTAAEPGYPGKEAVRKTAEYDAIQPSPVQSSRTRANPRSTATANCHFEPSGGVRSPGGAVSVSCGARVGRRTCTRYGWTSPLRCNTTTPGNSGRPHHVGQLLIDVTHTAA